MRKLFFLFKAVLILACCAFFFGVSAWFGNELFWKPHRLAQSAEAATAEGGERIDPTLPKFESAMALLKERKFVEARAALEQFLGNFPYSAKSAEARAALGQVNTDIFFSNLAAPEKIRYEVVRGDVLSKIEHKLKTTQELLVRCNNLDPAAHLRIGQVLWVSQPEFSAKIDAKTHVLTLLNHGKFFKEYAAVSWEAPEGKSASPTLTSARVEERIAWNGDARVLYGSKEYEGSARWVTLAFKHGAKGWTLYTEGAKKPPRDGIGFRPDDMAELSIFLRRGMTVSVVGL